MDDALIELRDVDVALGGQRVLRGVTWQLCGGEHWMIHGPNGSGKSTFLRLLRGEVWPMPNRGERIYRLDGVAQMTAIDVRRHIALVSPETQERYLQQEWRMTARDVIHTGFAQSDMLYVKLTREQKRRTETLAKELRIESLMDRDMQSLSTGELRKVLIARAVVGRPEVLLLDEVCDGLDANFRTSLLHMVETIAQHGTQIVYTTHRADEPLSVITHAVEFCRGRAIKSGPVGRAVLDAPGQIQKPPKRRHASPRVEDGATLQPLILIENADVFLDRAKILQSIRWQLRRGEHWVVLGGNGAGKTTFLKLIASDLYPAFGSRVARFELKADNTIWDLRRRIGCVSPLLQTHYREQVTGEAVVASGFFSSVGLMEKPSVLQLRRARALLHEFGLSHLRSRSMLGMSFGELRKVLTLRALVHDPQLIIFDEPFDGLDAESRLDFRTALDRVAARGPQLLVVTHHLDDLPQCITHGLFLERGRIAVEGEWPAVRAHTKVVALFGSDAGSQPRFRGSAHNPS